ncbi:ATP-binding protein [Sphingomonas sp. LY29]|uniref:sensor histidine kinase n=1 Tax=Sphingomonas sp. LY29 TaxID=3095341 RepID=UPI002D784D8B|nr:ATP-binding protein [Sphingomonas sp. LY29]WRP26349.1 ATP-binding protein [Sphingomonas sp. LY29]
MLKNWTTTAGKSLTRSPQAFITVFAVVSIGAIVALTAHQLAFEREQAAENVVRENRARVQSFEQYVLRTLEVADLATRHVEHLTRYHNGSSSQLPFTPNDAALSPIFTTVVVKLDTDRLLTTKGMQVDAPTSSRLLNYARSGRGDLVVTPPLPMTNGRTEIAIVRSLPTYPAGYVAVFVDPRRFTQFADNVAFSSQDLISLIGLDGITRARRTGNEFTNGERVAGLVMERQRRYPNGNYMGPSVLDGIPRYFSHRRLAQYKLFVTSGMPETIVDERTAQRRLVQLIVMALAILAILGASSVLLLTIRKRERRLRQLTLSNQRLNEAQRLGSMGDWDYFPATDELHWSDNLRQMYARSPSERVSSLQEVGRYISPESAERIKTAMEYVIATKEETTWDLEATMPDGRRSMRRIIAAPIVDDEGHVLGVHGTDQDVSREADMRALEIRLSELARLDSMRALAATLAHEINQPLGVAANYLGAATRTLAAPAGEASSVNTFLEAAKDQIEYIGHIIASARDMVGRSEANTQETSAVDLFESVRTQLAASQSLRSVRLEVTIQREAEIIRANLAQVKQVLLNLIKNAIEAVPADRVPRIAIAVSRDEANNLKFEIQDNGAGFPKTKADPFSALSTTKAGGMGFGLPLARTIVESHGGKIWVERSSSEGTTIAFFLEVNTNDSLNLAQA